MTEHNTSDPILVLVRRGRNGRGFSICPVEDISNPAICADSNEIGESIIEMLNDPGQSRVDVNQLLNPQTTPQTEPIRRGAEAIREEDDVDGVDDGHVQGDLADRLILQTLSAVIGKGRSMSSSRVRPSRAKKRP